MKILVCDEHEKKAIEGLLVCLHDDDVIDKFEFELKEYYKLDSADLSYLRAVVCDHIIAVDSKSYQTMIDGDMFDGKCAKCGKVTTGIIDESEGSLELLKSLHYHPENWKCESCLRDGYEE
jgi:hypothetical protein